MVFVTPAPMTGLHGQLANLVVVTSDVLLRPLRFCISLSLHLFFLFPLRLASLEPGAVLSKMPRLVRASVLWIADWCAPTCTRRESVDPNWLSMRLGRHVSRCVVEDLSGGRGLTSSVLALRATVVRASSSSSSDRDNKDNAGRGDDEEEEVPLVLKTTGVGAGKRSWCVSTGSPREGLFLAGAGSLLESIPALSGVIPKVVFAHGSFLLGECVVITENVSASGGCGANLATGNQIWGIPEDAQIPPVWRGDRLSVVREAYIQAARIHASTWRDRALLDGPVWLKNAAWLRGEGRLRWERGMDAARRMWAAGVARARDASSGVEIPSRLVSLMDAALARASFHRVADHFSRPGTAWCLCHGDFHANNMLALPDGSLRWIDWSEVGPFEPTSDVSQMIVSDIVLDESFTRDTARGLVKVYHDELLRRGVTGYPFEQCLDDWFRTGAEKWVWMLALISGLSLPAEATNYFVNQMDKFLELGGFYQDDAPEIWVKYSAAVTM